MCLIENFDKLIILLPMLGGFVAMLVNVGKVIKVVKDSTALNWVAGFNLLAFMAVNVVCLTDVTVDWGNLNHWMELLATAGSYVLTLVGSFISYKALKGVPVIGFSHEEQAKV